MSVMVPSLVTVTWHADGTTRKKKIELVTVISQNYPSIPVCAHLTSTNTEPDLINIELEECWKVRV